ncbi:uncharacterized protein LOC114344918 isoform X2 [Diabrotica virgifera virgifera]|uniref:Uncharacterized protein n=1 Tax=Diabrotica virgifera virgifera TaxID=50390 RepID=A0ABM5JWR3_DIAVI|nr:uncharacterized protein LOC114344918 isoform X2 [Diabrotica virgifera virgifera]
MNQNLKSCTQHSSDSSNRVYKIAKSRLRSFRSVTSKLYMARRKLQPVVNDILTASQNSDVKQGQQWKSYYLTIDQYKDAMWAARLLKEVEEILKLDKQKKPSFKTQSFNFDAKVKVNKGGKIYIDTPILLQLIDLHKLLGEIIDFLQEIPQDGNDTSSKEDISDNKSSQCKSWTVSTGSSEDLRQSEPEKITKEILTTLTMPLSTDFVVMANHSNSKIPSQQKPSALKMTPTNGSKAILSSSSRFTSTNNSSNMEEVVDAAGAKKIIVKCMADLDKVRHFLEKDYSVQSVTIEKPKSNSAVNARKGNNSAVNARNGNNAAVNAKNGDYSAVNGRKGGISGQNVETYLYNEETDYDMQHEGCCCLENCPGDQPLEFTWKENGETGSKLVICIKGKSEEDGDIHVVIRQCPECLHAVMTDESEECDGSVPEEDVQPVGPSVHSFKEPSKAEIDHSPTPPRDPSYVAPPPPRDPSYVAPPPPRDPSYVAPPPPRDPSYVAPPPPRDPSYVAPPPPRDPSYVAPPPPRDPSYVAPPPPRDPSHVSTHEPSHQKLDKSNHSHVIFDPEEPRRSIVEGPNIKLNDTVNLHLTTSECNQDLVISLSVKAKGVKSTPVINIDDILADSQTSVEKSKTSLNQSNSKLKK